MNGAEADPDAPTTASELMERQRGKNKLVLILLTGISLLFLLGALGVAALVLYGPY